MIDGSGKRNRQLAFELQNSHVCEKRSKDALTLFLFAAVGVQGGHYCLFCCYLPVICIWREKKLYHGQNFRNFIFHQKQTCIWPSIKGISYLKCNKNLCDILQQTIIAHTRME